MSLRALLGEIKPATMHVEAGAETSRDAGSIPAASTRCVQAAPPEPFGLTRGKPSGLTGVTASSVLSAAAEGRPVEGHFAPGTEPSWTHSSSTSSVVQTAPTMSARRPTRLPALRHTMPAEARGTQPVGGRSSLFTPSRLKPWSRPAIGKPSSRSGRGPRRKP